MPLNIRKKSDCRKFTLKSLKVEATAKKIKGRSKMNKEALCDALLKINKRTRVPGKNSKKRSIFDSKFAIIMNEFKMGNLKSSSGQRVTNRKQAIAIAFSEASRAAKRGTIVKPRIPLRNT